MKNAHYSEIVNFLSDRGIPYKVLNTCGDKLSHIRISTGNGALDVWPQTGTYYINKKHHKSDLKGLFSLLDSKPKVTLSSLEERLCELEHFCAYLEDIINKNNGGQIHELSPTR